MPTDRSPSWRRVARVIATGSVMVFLLALIVMARWIVRLQEAGIPESPLLLSAYDSVLPLVSLTIASFTFPIALISIITLMKTPEPAKKPSESAYPGRP